MFFSLNSNVSDATSYRDCSDRSGFLSLLKRCTSITMVHRVYHRMVATGYGEDNFLCNQVMVSYGRLGSVSEARALFDRIANRNIYSWNIMISCYQRAGHGGDSLQLFREMDLEGIKPDNYTFVSFLTACSELGDDSHGRFAHERALASGFLELDVSVGNSVINMYGKSGLVSEAEEAFEGLPVRNVITWNSMLGAYARNGYKRECLELYRVMIGKRVEPSYVTFVVVLSACSTLSEGRGIHSEIVSSGFPVNTTLENALIGFYSRCGSLEEARGIFNSMPSRRRNVVTWNSMISGYVQGGDSEKALEVYKLMELEPEVKPDKVSFISALGACSSAGLLAEGRRLHARIRAGGFDKAPAVANALINMYGRCGSPREAKLVFDELRGRDIISWNALMNALVQNGEAGAALELYRELQRECSPDAITFVIVLGACGNCGDLELGEDVHRRVNSTGLKDDLVIATALVTMFGKLGEMKKAKRVFEGIRGPSVVTWNAMITACVQNDQPGEALRLYRKMDVKPNEITYISVAAACLSLEDLEQGKLLHQRAAAVGYLSRSPLLANALIRMYGKCRNLENAVSLFNKMPGRTLSSWNSMITACVDNGDDRGALELFGRMKTEARPDFFTYMTILSACRSLGDLPEGRAVHSGMTEEDELDERVATSLINMYGSCGSLSDAEGVFRRIVRRDAICWTSMMIAHAECGSGAAGASLFHEMNLEGVEPDVITFSAIFFCCSHAGLLEQGWECFIIMVGDFGLRATQEHYVCMADLLGRLGWLEDAERIVDGMPYQPDSVAWLTLLSACNLQGKAGRAAGKAAGKAIGLGSSRSVSAPYALLSGICSTGVTGESRRGKPGD